MFTPSTPAGIYTDFSEQITEMSADFVDGARDALRRMPPEEQEKVISGAREVHGEAEAERLQSIADGQPVQDTAPPRPIPPQAGDIGSGAGTRQRWRGPPSQPPIPPERFGSAPHHGVVKVGGYSFNALPNVEDVLAKMRVDGPWQVLADKLSQPRMGQGCRAGYKRLRYAVHRADRGKGAHCHRGDEGADEQGNGPDVRPA